MTNIDKIKFINEYDMLDSIREEINVYNHNELFSNINYILNEKINLYPIQTYKQYKVELQEEYKGNLTELIKLIKQNCNDTVNKMFWLKELSNI